MTGRKRNPRPAPEFADTAFVSAQDIAKIYGIPAAYIVKSAGDGKFPTPLQMGGKRSRLYWKYSDVVDFFNNWHRSTNNSQRFGSSNLPTLEGASA